MEKKLFIFVLDGEADLESMVRTFIVMDQPNTKENEMNNLELRIIQKQNYIWFQVLH